MTKEVCRKTAPLMGTLVTIAVVAHSADPQQTSHREESIERAFEWFRHVEERCTRFDSRSELMQLTTQVGVAVPVSDLLYETIRFALSMAEETDGAFDPTVGHAMETRGFNREYSTAQIVHTDIQPARPVSYRDIRLDPARKTVTLLCPLILDLGAVAKGLAIDLAAQELRTLEDFSVDAGGDLYLGGSNARGESWSIGIRHPRLDNQLIDSIRVSDRAVCTSGDYERRIADNPAEHHILDPRSGATAGSAASVTVIAPSAMLADALATAAFVLGPTDGIQLLDRLGVDGLIISPTLDRFATQGMSSDYKLGGSAVL